MFASELLSVGSVYNRQRLREMFDITLNTGIFQPNGYDSVWLFVTENTKPEAEGYRNFLDGNVLDWDGQLGGRKDGVIASHVQRGLELLLFYRKKRTEFPDAGFKYFGRVEYMGHTGSRPAHFRLRLIGA
jgi:hypothetical protein